MDVWQIFTNPLVIVVLCVAFALPILLKILKKIQKKYFSNGSTRRNAEAQHVRDVVKKYDKKNH